MQDQLLHGRIAFLIDGLHGDAKHLIPGLLAVAIAGGEGVAGGLVQDALDTGGGGIEHSGGIDNGLRSHVQQGVNGFLVPAVGLGFGFDLGLGVLLNVRHPRGAVHLAAPVRVKHINAGQVGADAGFAGFAVGCRESHAVLGAQFTRHTPRPHGGKQRVTAANHGDNGRDIFRPQQVVQLGLGGIGNGKLLLGCEQFAIGVDGLHARLGGLQTSLGEFGLRVILHQILDAERDLRRAHALLPADVHHGMAPGVFDLPGEIALAPQLGPQALPRLVFHQRLDLLGRRCIAGLHGDDLHLGAFDGQHFQHRELVDGFTCQMHAGIGGALEGEHLFAVVRSMLAPILRLPSPNSQRGALMVLHVLNPRPQIGERKRHLVDHPGRIERFIGGDDVGFAGFEVGSEHGRAGRNGSDKPKLPQHNGLIIAVIAHGWQEDSGRAVLPADDLPRRVLANPSPPRMCHHLRPGDQGFQRGLAWRFGGSGGFWGGGHGFVEVELR